MGKRIVDIKTSVVKGKMLKTVIYSDGSKQVGIISDDQIGKMVRAIEGAPDLKLIVGQKKQSQAGNIGALIVIVAMMYGLMTLAAYSHKTEDRRCSGEKWYTFDDCF